ncbi:MAG: sigma-70 family RNA polymerase sigma factor [Bryobacteraceae bacterium]
MAFSESGHLLSVDEFGSGSEAEWVEQLRKRDPKALGAAYDRYGKPAYSLFLRITRDPNAAEDLVQELFIRVWNRAREFDAQRGAFGVWILSIARNMAIDHTRSADVKFAARLRSLDHVDPLRFALRDDPTEPLIDCSRAISASHLNDNERRVLELAYFEGLSQSEIAARINQPLGTVKSWTRSALDRLRTAVRTDNKK